MSKTVKILDEFKINYLTQAQYDAEVAGGTVQPDELYLTLDNSASATQTLTNKTIDKADNTVTCTPTVITDALTVLSPTKEMFVIMNATSGVLNVSNNSPYGGYTLPIYAQKDCTVNYKDYIGTSESVSLNAKGFIRLVGMPEGIGWILEKTVKISGKKADGNSFVHMMVTRR